MTAVIALVAVVTTMQCKAQATMHDVHVYKDAGLLKDVCTVCITDSLHWGVAVYRHLQSCMIVCIPVHMQLQTAP